MKMKTPQLLAAALVCAVTFTSAQAQQVPLPKTAAAPGRLEALQGSRAGQYSIRVNDQFRLCFRWTAAGPEDVEIVDYH